MLSVEKHVVVGSDNETNVTQEIIASAINKFQHILQIQKLVLLFLRCLLRKVTFLPGVHNGKRKTNHNLRTVSLAPSRLIEIDTTSSEYDNSATLHGSYSKFPIH